MSTLKETNRLLFSFTFHLRITTVTRYNRLVILISYFLYDFLNIEIANDQNNDLKGALSRYLATLQKARRSLRIS